MRCPERDERDRRTVVGQHRAERALDAFAGVVGGRRLAPGDHRTLRVDQRGIGVRPADVDADAQADVHPASSSLGRYG